MEYFNVSQSADRKEIRLNLFGIYGLKPQNSIVINN